MTTETFLNDPITVKASIDHNGSIIPTSLIWQGKRHTITAAGRQWETDNGQHILVETANGDRFEIQLSRKDLLWYLKRAWREELAA